MDFKRILKEARDAKYFGKKKNYELPAGPDGRRSGKAVVLNEGDEAYTTNLCLKCFNKHLHAKGEKPPTNVVERGGGKEGVSWKNVENDGERTISSWDVENDGERTISAWDVGAFLL